MSLIQRLAIHLARPVEESDRALARVHLLDWLACVAGARREDIGAGDEDPVIHAAMLGNMLEMDDVHRAARLHPGPVVWPAALGAAQAAGVEMAAVLDAGVRGYEAMIALGETLDAYHYARWHPTTTAGGLGAAAAAASVLTQSAEQVGWAMAHAASLAGGLWHMRHGNSRTKQVHIAHAVRSGMWFARLAAAGVSGASGVLEGEQGLYAGMCKVPSPMRFPEAWRIGEVSLKPWAACRHAHPAIDAALELHSTDGTILVETYADALAFCDRPEPSTAAGARFSLQHSVAVVLVHGSPRPEHFEPEAIAALADVRSRVSVAEAADFSERYPAHFGARVSAGGKTVERVDTLGDPERPLDEAGQAGKLETLIAWGGLANGEADRARRAVQANDLSAVLDLLQDWTA